MTVRPVVVPSVVPSTSSEESTSGSLVGSGDASVGVCRSVPSFESAMLSCDIDYASR